MIRRWGRGLLYVLLCSVLLLFGLLTYAMSTQSGLDLLISQAKKHAPGSLEVVSAKGRLLGPLSLQGVSYVSPELDASVDSLELRWSPSALLTRTIKVSRLHTGGLRLTRKLEAPAAEDATESAPLPENFRLPVGIELQDLRIVNSQLVLSAGADPVIVDSVTLAASYPRQADLNLNAEVISSLADLQARLHYDPDSGNALDGLLEYTLRPDGVAAMTGSTVLSGSLDALQIKQQLDSPYSIDATAVLENPLTNLSLDASVNYAINSLSDIKADLPPTQLEGNLDFQGSPSAGLSSLTLTLSNMPDLLPGELTVDAAVQIADQLISIQSLEARATESPLTINGQGSIDIASSQPVVDLRLDWKDLGWPLFGEQLINRINGSAQVGGSPDSYKVLMNTSAQTPALDSLEVTTSTQGSLSHADTAINLQALDGSLDGQFDLTLKPVLGFKAAARGEGIDPQALLPDWPGNLALTLNASGQTVDEELAVTLDVLELAGELRTLPVQLSARATTAGKDVSIETLALRSGPTTLDINGKVAEQFDLDWSINSPDLSTLLPDANGEINGTGWLRGSASEPVVSARLEAAGLAYQEYGLKSLSLNSNVDTASTGKLDTTLELLDGRFGETVLDEFRLTAKGDMNAHNILANAVSNQGNVDVALTGSLEGKSWLYALTSGRVEYPALAPWELKEPAGGIVSADKSSIDAACFISANAELCVNGDYTVDGLSADYQLTAMPLSYFKSLMPETTRVLGLVDSEGSIAQAAQSAEPVVKTKLDLTNVRVDVTSPDNEWVRVATLNPGVVNALFDANGLDASAKLDLVGQGGLTANLKVSNNGNAFAEQPLTGKISADIKNVAFLAKLSPEIEKLQGRFLSDIALSGTPSVPEIAGELVFDNGVLNLQTPGLELTAIKARITGRGDDPLVVTASARSGEGQVSINGNVLPSVDKPMLDLVIKGDDFTVANTIEAQAAISPDIRLKLQQEQLVFDGVLGIPFAAITPVELPAGVVQVSPDQVIVGSEEQKPSTSALKLRGKLKIVLGDDVTVDAFGLNAKLAGDLTATESPGAATTAKGQLDIVDGTFKAYGQNLKIRTGKVLFAGGPIAEPGFDVEAVRLVTTELEVGVRARGAISKPEFSLFSSPPMAESEQISYLVLGRPLQDNSASENSAVRQAAMALGVAGGTLLTEKFGNKLGVDEIKIDSELRETGEQASLVVGKYLSPKLFVSYGIGLFEPVSTLRLNYSITDYLKLVTETTESKSGGDFIFTFERGR